MSDTSHEIETLMARVRAGDESATSELWHQYFERLVRVAASRLPGNLRRVGDEEDIALSAFNSFVAGVKEDQFPELRNPDNLWGLLMTLTTRKLTAHMRRQTRQKRGGGQVRGESVFICPDGEPRGGISDAVSGDESPSIQMELNEACEALLNGLEDEQLRQIAVMRMDGFLVDEIAERLELSKRAVERRLQLIRKIWAEAL